MTIKLNLTLTSDFIHSVYSPVYTLSPHLYVFCQAVEDLLGHRHGLGEVPLAWLINDVFSRVVPVEVTDGLLQGAGGRRRGGDGGGEGGDGGERGEKEGEER